MFNLDSLRLSPEDLDPEDRKVLTELLAARLEFSKIKLELDQLRVKQLMGQHITDEQLALLADLKLGPARKEVSRLIVQLFSRVDKAKLIEDGKMLLQFVLQNLPLPLPAMLLVLGLDPDHVADVIDVVRRLLSGGDEK